MDYRPLLGLSDTMTEWDFINQIFKTSCQMKTVDHTAMTISLIISIYAFVPNIAVFENLF